MSASGGWRELTPHEIGGEDKSALVIGPFGSSLKVSDYRTEGVPLIFVRDVRSGDFTTPRHFIDPQKAAELGSHVALPGDVLITKMGDPPGDSCVYNGTRPSVITADCIRLRPASGFDPRYISLILGSPQVRRQMEEITSGVAQRKVSLARFRSGLRIPIPKPDEQRHIVEILEDHLSRLDVARGYLLDSKRRLEAMVTAVLMSLIPGPDHYPPTWEPAIVAEAGTVGLGRQRHPDWHSGPNMRPYLRVANVFEDRIDTRDVKEMHWSEATFDRFKLHHGDVLLNEGQTPELLGRPALYRGDPPEVAFTNSILRFKASEKVMPEFALLVFRRHMRAGRFKRESRITTNIAHLSAARLKPIEFPIPPLSEQRAIVDLAKTAFDAIARLRSEIDVTTAKQVQLRRSLLTKAFNGGLVAP